MRRSARSRRRFRHTRPFLEQSPSPLFVRCQDATEEIEGAIIGVRLLPQPYLPMGAGCMEDNGIMVKIGEAYTPVDEDLRAHKG